MPTKGLLARLRGGEDIIVAEGYLFELERRGYLKAGTFVPEVVTEHPDVIRSLHEEFVHSGSDVVLALTYYAHREKLRVVGREDELEIMNRTALKIARDVADRTGTLMAGNICNTTIYETSTPETYEPTNQIFKEQIEWAVEEKADFIVGETFGELGEAMIALEAIKKYVKGLPAVITMTILQSNLKTVCGVPFAEALRQLEESGAAVVGINCGRGPATILPMMEEARRVCKFSTNISISIDRIIPLAKNKKLGSGAIRGPLAALPVPYRTRDEPQHNFMSLLDAETGKRVFPNDLPALACTITEVADFGRKAKQLGIQYVGLCCGSASHYLREVAEAYGRKPQASRYSPDMSQHFILGNDPKFIKGYTEGLREKILS